MTSRINPQELPGLVAELRGRSAVAPWRGHGEAELNTRAANTLESLAAENERLTEENADLRNRLSRIVAC
jgi:cell division protein FtsB